MQIWKNKQFPMCLHWCEDLEEEEEKDQDKGEDVSLNLDEDLEEQTRKEKSGNRRRKGH